MIEDEEFEMIRKMENAKMSELSDQTLNKVFEAIRVIDQVI